VLVISTYPQKIHPGNHSKSVTHCRLITILTSSSYVETPILLWDLLSKSTFSTSSGTSSTVQSLISPKQNPTWIQHPLAYKQPFWGYGNRCARRRQLASVAHCSHQCLRRSYKFKKKTNTALQVISSTPVSGAASGVEAPVSCHAGRAARIYSSGQARFCSARIGTAREPADARLRQCNRNRRRKRSGFDAGRDVSWHNFAIKLR